MLSRFQRNLSFLLVAIVAMSWLLVPYQPIPVAKAQTSIGVGGLPVEELSGAVNPSIEVAPADILITGGYQLSYTPDATKANAVTFSWQQATLTNAPASKRVADRYIIEYVTTTDVPGGMTDAICRSPSLWKPLGTELEGTAASSDTRAGVNVDAATATIAGSPYFRLSAKRTVRLANLGGIGTSTLDAKDLTTPVPLSCGKSPLAARTGTGAVANLFGRLKNNADDTYNFNLIDDPSDTTDVNDDGKPDPKLPPHIIVSKDGFLPPLSEDLDFTLKHLVRSSTTFWATDNNYFLFSMEDLTDTQKSELKERGIEEPSNYYLGIDMAGNIGFLIDDVSKNGGLFSTGKDKFDANSNNPIAVGQFSHDPVSKNALGEPLIINTAQYKDIITSRVYNEARTGIGTNTCDADKIINYPDRNTTYEPDADFTSASENGLPAFGFRQCIHIPNPSEPSPQGWLTTWKITDTKIDTPAADACLDSFSGSGWFFQNTVGKTLCTVVNMSMGLAVTLAMFCVDFLIEAMGLQ